MTIAITIVLQLTCHTIHCVDGGVLSPVCQIPILSSAAEAGTVQCSDGCRQWAVAGQQGPCTAVTVWGEVLQCVAWWHAAELDHWGCWRAPSTSCPGCESRGMLTAGGWRLSAAPSVLGGWAGTILSAQPSPAEDEAAASAGRHHRPGHHTPSHQPRSSLVTGAQHQAHQC